MGILDKILGDPNAKIIKTIQPQIDKINELERNIKKMSDEELKRQTEKFREYLDLKKFDPRKRLTEDDRKELEKKLEDILPESFATIREASRRILKMRHYDVQLIGGIVLHRGQIAEMKTGEGKTLVATLPLYLNALSGRGVQLITVNDYLARVGAGWMAPVYYSLGMSTAVIIHDSALIYDPEYIDDSQYDDRLKNFRPIERKEAYACDILYGTNNEFGFDYLRDNMAPDLSRMAQRELNYSIVDEIDSILIDEARTPLIISAPAEESTDKYYKFADLVRRLKENEDYNVDEKMKASTLTEAGIAKMEKWLNVDNIYTEGGIREVHHIEQALKAHALFKKDKDYVVKDGEVIIVDEFTGRLMHGRRYSEGLHQAIEAKENVAIQRESQTLATVTFQNYFRLYHKLSGMTGTAVTEAEEFSKIYSLETVVIPTNKPNVRDDRNDLIYRTEMGKYQAVINDIKERNKKGQPVLIGTISIEKNETLSNMMERNGLRPQLLNAKNHEKEAQIISDAGKVGSITIATNMAGRGVDIMLGGTEPEEGTSEHRVWQEEREKVLALGGLHVIGTERHESRRIDNQLRGRSGRQGDPGSSQFFVSMEDDLMRIFGGDRMKSIMTSLNVPEDMPIENKLISRSLESAQKKVEGNNFDARKHLVEFDDVINRHRESIYRRRRRILDIYENSKAEEGDSPVIFDEKDKDIPDLKFESLKDLILNYIEAEIEQVVSFHTSADNIEDWNIEEILQVASTIFPVGRELPSRLSELVKGDSYKLEKAKIRTKIIERLNDHAKKLYEGMEIKAKEFGIDWGLIEKSVLIRAIDTLWVEHLEAMASVRQGIGLRGYGQRDPLIEYKKEAFRLYNELKSLIQKEVVYSVFKVGVKKDESSTFTAPSLVDRAKNFSAPAKTMDNSNASFAQYKKGANDKQKETHDMVRPKVKNEAGEKVGRNDPCPCGSGKKFKKCHGR